MKYYTRNEISHHLCVAAVSIIFALLLWFAGYGSQRVVAAIPFFVLFFVMVIGPIVKIWPSITKRFSGGFPVNWRSELGIWFAIWSVVHVFFVFWARDWNIIGYLIDMSPWAFGAFIAVILAIILAITSNTKSLVFMGPKSWKWHQSHGTYLIFWLATVHVYDRAYLRPGFPSTDPIHWTYLIMIAIVIILHIVAFTKVIHEYRETGEYPLGIS